MFLAADAKRYEELDDAVRQYLAWKELAGTEERIRELELPPQQAAQARKRLKDADETVDLRISASLPLAARPRADDEQPAADRRAQGGHEQGPPRRTGHRPAEERRHAAGRAGAAEHPARPRPAPVHRSGLPGTSRSASCGSTTASTPTCPGSPSDRCWRTASWPSSTRRSGTRTASPSRPGTTSPPGSTSACGSPTRTCRRSSATRRCSSDPTAPSRSGNESEPSRKPPAPPLPRRRAAGTGTVGTAPVGTGTDSGAIAGSGGAPVPGGGSMPGPFIPQRQYPARRPRPRRPAGPQEHPLLRHGPPRPGTLRPRHQPAVPGGHPAPRRPRGRGPGDHRRDHRFQEGRLPRRQDPHRLRERPHPEIRPVRLRRPLTAQDH